MSVILAGAWYPRGELTRFERHLPLLRDLYNEVVVSVPDDVDIEIMMALDRLHVPYVAYGGRSGRHQVVALALQQDGTHLHYIDLDRLIRWVETHPDELRSAITHIAHTDCLVIGRTEAAYATHPRALIETERLVNMVFSQHLGRAMDFCAGSKGLSRELAQFILLHSPDDDTLRMDAGWAILAKRGSFTLDYIAVDGMDWESADQFRDVAADARLQQRLAADYDALPESWSVRVGVAHRIMQRGLQAIDALSDGR